MVPDRYVDVTPPAQCSVQEASEAEALAELMRARSVGERPDPIDNDWELAVNLLTRYGHGHLAECVVEMAHEATRLRDELRSLKGGG